MNGRALIAIGCNAYDQLSPLSGGEADAQDVFDTLMLPNVGDYDVARSRLLLSPKLDEVREALLQVLLDGEPLDTLTLTFAGHGTVAAGSFYMALRDTRPHALSATALPLADVLRMVAEAAPKQTYIFIDACEAGGLIADLNVILKSEVMGEIGTPGVTLVATAAAKQSAIEQAGRGIGTSALLDCVRGDVFLQDISPALDLAEIGRAVSDRVSNTGGQTPVVWGLNLYGPSSFCRNPHAGSNDAPLRSVLVGWPDAGSVAVIRAGLPKLWKPFVDLPHVWEPRALLDGLAPLLAGLGGDASVTVGLVSRIEEAFASRARESNDRFREIEVRAAFAASLLPRSDDPMVEAHLLATCRRLAGLVETAIADVVSALGGYEYALLNGGLEELYQLPIRLSKLLGWAGFVVHACLITGQDMSSAAERLEELYGRIFGTYSLSLVAMNDCQAPYILTALTASKHATLNDSAEQLLGYMFASAIECRGRVARVDIEPSKILSYLISRIDQADDPNLELVAQPTELVSVLLRASRLFDLHDEFDLSLSALDHLAINAYLPDEYRGFADEVISGGSNIVRHIGHDIWTVDELETSWPVVQQPSGPGQAMAAIVASLLCPDRSPWFLMPFREQTDA
jgi:hypothetical protein